MSVRSDSEINAQGQAFRPVVCVQNQLLFILQPYCAGYSCWIVCVEESFMVRMRSLLLGIVVIILPVQLHPAQANSLGAERSVDIIYSGRWLGIPIVSSKISAAFVGENYAIRAGFRTSGFISIFKKITVLASASGQFKDNQLTTKEYWHKELDGRKNRELSMNYEPELVTVRVDPPLFSMGDPPATMAQRLEAHDPVSAILTLAIQAGHKDETKQCAGTIPVFDGKQRYDLRLQMRGVEKIRTRAYRGMALRCDVWYVPVAGFDADDLADLEVYQTPITIWLAQEPKAGLRLPVRFEAKLDFGTVVVEARKIEVTTNK